MEKKTTVIGIRIGEETNKDLEILSTIKRRNKSDTIRILIEDDIERHRELIEDYKKKND